MVSSSRVEEITEKMSEVKMKERVISVLDNFKVDKIKTIEQLRKLCCRTTTDEQYFSSLGINCLLPISTSELTRILRLDYSHDVEKLYPLTIKTLGIIKSLTDETYKLFILHKFLDSIGLKGGAKCIQQAMFIAPPPKIVEIYLDYLPTQEQSSISKIGNFLITTKDKWILDLTHSRKNTSLSEIKCPIISDTDKQQILMEYEMIINGYWGSVFIKDKKAFLAIK